MLHEVEERVCDEMTNVSDNVHEWRWSRDSTVPTSCPTSWHWSATVRCDEGRTSCHRKVIERK